MVKTLAVRWIEGSLVLFSLSLKASGYKKAASGAKKKSGLIVKFAPLRSL